MTQCLLHPENMCLPDAQFRCVCAPPGMSHEAKCATKHGERCDCHVASMVQPFVHSGSKES